MGPFQMLLIYFLVPSLQFVARFYTANDMQLIPIEKVYSNRDSIRKAREAFLISKGRTLFPHGFNIREEMY